MKRGGGREVGRENRGYGGSGEILRAMISTHPHQWWTVVAAGRTMEGVEGAACVQGPTPSPIPQSVITIEYGLATFLTACITEIVIPYKCWRRWSLG